MPSNSFCISRHAAKSRRFGEHGLISRACFAAVFCESAALNTRQSLLAAGLLGASGVCLGAFGAHALHGSLAGRGMLEVWETAVRYQLLHAVALAGAAGWLRAGSGASGTWAVRLWIAGVVLFSGSLYGLALGGPRWLGPVTPLGGASLIAGWACLAAFAWSLKPDER